MTKSSLAIVAALLMCLSSCEITSDVCEGKTRKYTIRLTDSTLLDPQPDVSGCTYHLYLRSGDCKLTTNPAPTQRGNYTCYDISGDKCEWVTDSLSGYSEENCAGTPRTELFKEVSPYVVNQAFNITSGLMQARVTVQMECDGYSANVPRCSSFGGSYTVSVALLAVLGLLILI